MNKISKLLIFALFITYVFSEDPDCTAANACSAVTEADNSHY